MSGRTRRATRSKSLRKPARSTPRKRAAARRTPPPPPPKHRPEVFLRLLLIGALFALAFYAVNAEWLALRNIDVRGGVRLSDREVAELAALDTFNETWGIFVPCERIRESLEAHPLIDQAEVTLPTPWTLRIRITERRPLAALNHKGFKLLFDRTGELISVLHPQEICLYPIVEGVPPGLLRNDGIPLHRTSEAWAIPPSFADAESLELQFGRLIHLRQLLDRYGDSPDSDLDNIEMDERGHFIVHYSDCPPILLGNLENPDLQVRRMLAVIEQDEIADPIKTMDIDLSSELFPCYHVREQFYSPEERRQMQEWKDNPPDTESEEDGSSEQDDADEGEASDTEEGHAIGFDPAIFDLAGGDTSDDRN